MQIYPVGPGFTVGCAFTLGVQPNARFCIALYQQQGDETLTSFSGVQVQALGGVAIRTVAHKCIFETPPCETITSFDQPWCWPTVTLRPNAAEVPSGIYVAVAFEVESTGAPIDALGRRCAAHLPLDGRPPACDSMALLVGRPTQPRARIAYIVPVATYHAYNWTGGGSFYDDYARRTPAHSKITLMRPGGGFGSRPSGPRDPFDMASPRQTFMHWDAKFVRWLRTQSLDCDFYTDVDLHSGTTLDLAHYRCMLSIGHHEYWSERMRTHVRCFLAGGGNLAVFSGNTCYRPIEFDDVQAPQHIERLAEQWPEHDETALIGLSYGFGAGRWGDWHRFVGWTGMKREPVGFTVRGADHWVFAGTSLANGDVFGERDHLVGYEADGVRPGSSAFTVLADTPKLPGWDMGGACAMGVLGPDDAHGPKAGLVFNCGTTDWARVLMDGEAMSQMVVRQITRNVVRAFAGLDDAYVSFADAPQIVSVRSASEDLVMADVRA
jgi:hypothetical protein